MVMAKGAEVVDVVVGDDPFDLLLNKESPPALAAYYNIQVPVQDYDDDGQQPYIVIPIPPSNRTHLRICICCLCCCNRQLIRITLLFFLMACILLWLLSPSHPRLEVVRVQLDNANISRSSSGAIVFLDTSMELRVMIQNRDYISHTYNLISILVGYHGKWLGSTTTNATFVNARSVSYLEATVELNGSTLAIPRSSTAAPVPAEAAAAAAATALTEEDGGLFHVGEESAPLEIVIEVGAKFHFFSINVPIQAMASCTVNVDVGSQNITSQDCYPEEEERSLYRSTTYSSANLEGVFGAQAPCRDVDVRNCDGVQSVPRIFTHT